MSSPQQNETIAGNIKTAEEIEKMRVAGRLTGQVLEAVSAIIKPGITTMAIDEFCEDYIRNTLHAIPGSKGQYGYPYSVNTSLNHVICHGMPSTERVLEVEDIVNVDITVIKDGYFGDSSKTFCLQPVKPHAQRLVDVTQQCLYLGIRAVKPGVRFGEIGKAIETHAKKNGYSVVQEYCGHGIGQKMHESPHVMHYYVSPSKDPRKPSESDILMQPGMTFTIEPMINQGLPHIKLKKVNGWEIAETKDRRLSAQWEHTILVTPTGFEILTLRDEERNSALYLEMFGS